MIFKKVGAHRPYPQHGMSNADWGSIPPQQVRLDWLTTTQKTLDLETLLAEDSTYFGDLFPHVVKMAAGALLGGWPASCFAHRVAQPVCYVRAYP